MGAELIQGQHLVDALLTLLAAKIQTPQVAISNTAKVSAPSKIISSLCDALKDKEPLLWKGDWQSSSFGILGYPLQSEADMALCGAIARHAVSMGIAEDILEDAVLCKHS